MDLERGDYSAYYQVRMALPEPRYLDQKHAELVLRTHCHYSAVTICMQWGKESYLSRVKLQDSCIMLMYHMSHRTQ